MAIRKYSEMAGSTASQAEDDQSMVRPRASKRCKVAPAPETTIPDETESLEQFSRHTSMQPDSKPTGALTTALDDTTSDDLASAMQKMSIQQDSNATADVTPSHPQASVFRFLDLPSETRNMIYSIVVADHEMDYDMSPSLGPFTLPAIMRASQQLRSPSLGSFTLPAITRASQQLRNESVGMCFFDTEFQVNFTVRAHDNMSISLVRMYDNLRTVYPDDLDTPRELACDSLCLEPAVRGTIKSFEGTVLFRNVTFSVSEVFRETFQPFNDFKLCKIGLEVPACEMTLKVGRTSGTKVEIIKDEDDWDEWTYWQEDDLLAGMEGAKNKAEEIASMEGFQGYTLGDLQEVAKLFASSTADGARD